MLRKSAHIAVTLRTSNNFKNFTPGGGQTVSKIMKGDLKMPRKAYFKQNDGRLPKDPPHYLGRLAKGCWRKVVPFLESTQRVQRIDDALVEQYCSEYEIYRQAYQDIQENGIQTKLFNSLQDSTGQIIGKDFAGYRKNPAVATMNDALKQLKSIGSQLGLSPQARQELMQIASHKKEKSVAEQFKDIGLV